MRKYFSSPSAQRDILAILAWTEENFGEAMRKRYELLIIRSIQDVAAEMNRPGSHEVPEIGPGLRIYHLSHSRDRIPKRLGRVRAPRHFLLYRLPDPERVEIVRVLHDSMDLGGPLRLVE